MTNPLHKWVNVENEKPNNKPTKTRSVKTTPEAAAIEKIDWLINDYLKPRTLPTTILERTKALGFDPLSAMITIHNLALESFKAGRGYSDKSDAGPGYLSIAQKAAECILNKTAPNLQALKIDVNKAQDLPPKSISAAAAIKALTNDPFLDVQISELPIGNANKMEKGTSTNENHSQLEPVDKDEK